MKKQIFELFNIKNNIFLDQSCIDYLANQANTKENILNEYIQTFGKKTVNFTELQTLYNKSTKLYTTKNTNQNVDKYDFLYEIASETIAKLYITDNKQENKNRCTDKTTIETIDKLKNGTITHIFGLIYKNKEDEYCLKDKTGKITLNLQQCLQEQKINAFFISGMFIIIKGVKKNNITFDVHDIIIPEIEKDTNKVNKKCVNTDFSALIFGKAIDNAILNNILSNFDTKPEIVIMNIETSKDLRFVAALSNEIESTRIILVISSDIYLQNLATINKLKVKYKIDYCDLQFYNKILTFQNNKLYTKTKSEGVFIGQNIDLAFAKSLTSQCSSNFVNDHLDLLPNRQDLFFIFSDQDSVNLSIANTQFIVYNSDNNTDQSLIDFYFYDSTTNTCEYSVYEISK